MIDAFLAFLGLRQAAAHKSAGRFAVASSHLVNVEKTCLETGVRLVFEIDRLGCLAEDMGAPIDFVVAPLVTMQQQNEQLRALVKSNRDLLKKRGANAVVVAELDHWAGTCQIIGTQIDLTVRQVEDSLNRV